MKKLQNNNYSYDGSVLFKARKRLKISIDDIARELTLSTSQIQSIEENLSYGYATPYFRRLAIERYAKNLNIHINKVILYQEINPINLDSTEAKPVRSLSNFLNKVKYLSIIILLIILFFSYFIFTGDQEKNVALITEKKINTLDNYLEPHPMIVLTPKEIISADNLTDQNIIDIPSQPVTNTVLNFDCTIQSSPVTSFTTKTPDKPSSYFHLESLADQSICTIDSDGKLKTYNLIAGDKLTHRGKPPFKIQLDPTASTLYFQGWIVYLKASNQFIQLDPALPASTD